MPKEFPDAWKDHTPPEGWSARHEQAFDAADELPPGVLRMFREEVDRALEDGCGFREFLSRLKPRIERLAAHGGDGRMH